MNRSTDKSLFGYRYYTVLTPSMEPELSVGDMVFVHVVDAATINVGDIITFNPSSDSDAYLTHRVTQIVADGDTLSFRTKGDANETEDSFLIDESRVIGTVSFDVPYAGYIVRFVQIRWYFVVAFVVLVIIFFMLLGRYLKSGQGTTTQEINENTEPIIEKKEDNYDSNNESKKLSEFDEEVEG